MLEILTSNTLLINRVADYSAQYKIVSPGQTIIIGLSGGPDSVVLLHVFAALQARLKLTLVAAHLDHGWRAESAQEVEFCKKISTQLGVTFVHEHATNILSLKKTSGSLENQGRLLRRAFFAQVAHQYNADVIALGHHSDDQQETFFIRLMRGAGVAGLAGIKPRDGSIIHPLLCCTKEEIVAFLTTQNIPYLTDPTNSDDQFLRNRIRKDVLPALRACDARFDNSLARTMERLREADDFITEHTQELFSSITVEENGTYWLTISELLKKNSYLQKQLLLQWFISANVPFTPSTKFFNEVIRFLRNKQSNQHTLYHTWQILKKANKATITFCA